MEALSNQSVTNEIAELTQKLKESQAKIREENNKYEFKPVMQYKKEDGQLIPIGFKKGSVQNISAFIERIPQYANNIQFNEFNQSVTYCGEALEDSVLVQIRQDIEIKYGYISSTNDIKNGVLGYAIRHTYNPVKARITSVTWDKKDRLKTALHDYFGAEQSEYTERIFKMWMTALVMRVFKPASKFDTVLVITGKQGIGKTTFFENMMTDKYWDTITDKQDEKRAGLNLMDNAIIEFGELEFLKNMSIPSMKNFLSKKYDKGVPMYGTHSKSFPRHTVFVGTTNDVSYLNDPTGSRRFWPVRGDEHKATLDPRNVKDHIYLEMLAQAKYLFDNQYKVYFEDREEKRLLSPQLRQAQRDDIQADEIERYISMPYIPDGWSTMDIPKKRLYFYSRMPIQGSQQRFLITNITEILEVALNMSRDDAVNKTRGSLNNKVSRILRQNGWDKGTGRNRYNYVRS